MRLISQLLALSVFGLASAAHADTLSYTYVDAGVLSTELDDGDLDGEGPFVRGSLSVHQNAFLFAEVSDIGYDNNVDGFTWAVGGGGRVALNSQFDLVGKLGYVRVDFDVPGGDFSDSGYLVSALVRAFVVDKLELEGGVRHVNMDDLDSDTALVAEGRYFFTPRIAGGVHLQAGDNTAFGIHARFTF